MFLATCIFSSVILVLPASIEARSALMGVAEDIAYVTLKAAIVNAGKSEYYASCFVRMLKLQGTTGSVLTLDFERLRDDFQLADSICSIDPIIMFPVLIVIFLITLCCCCKRCCGCADDTRHNQIQVIIPSRARNYMRGQKAEDEVEIIGKGSQSTSYP